MNNEKWGCFLVDKLVGGGLDDWEVKIADFVVLLGKDGKNVRIAGQFETLWGKQTIELKVRLVDLGYRYIIQHLILKGDK